MSEGFVFELDFEGVGQLLKSPGVMDACRKYAQGLASHAGIEADLSQHEGKTRVNVSIPGEAEKILGSIR